MTFISICLLAAGCLVIGAAPGWPVAAGAAVVEGAGWGTLVIIFNTLFASGFGARSAAVLTLLNAVFGLGSSALARAGLGQDDQATALLGDDGVGALGPIDATTLKV